MEVRVRVTFVKFRGIQILSRVECFVGACSSTYDRTAKLLRLSGKIARGVSLI